MLAKLNVIGESYKYKTESKASKKNLEYPRAANYSLTVLTETESFSMKARAQNYLLFS